MDTAPAGGSAVSSGMASSTYADSMDSSPRSRGGESWDEPYPSSNAPPKLRLMCSYGGHIVPRPHDKSLCYLGGETRIVVVERHTILSDLSAKLSRSLLAGLPFTLKYQLPSEDLDSLISVTTDEDLDNMIEEYDRIAAGPGGKASRLRLFLFPVKVDSPSPSSSSIGSLLDDSKSETWFVDALNGAIGVGGVLSRRLSGDSAASSVNCLLGLEDEQNPSAVAHPVANASGAFSEQGSELNNHHCLIHQHNHHHQSQLPRPDSSGKLKQGQEVHSVPDSPMLDNTSSFGSTSSAPSLSHLPPIRVRPDDRSPDKSGYSGGGLDEHFSQMNLQKHEGFKDGGFGGVMHHQHVAVAVPVAAVAVNPPTHVASTASAVTSIAAAAVAAASSASPTDNPNHGGRAFSSDDEKSDLLGVRNPTEAPLVQPQKTSNAFDLSISDRPIQYQERTDPALAAWSSASDLKQEVQSSVSESSYRAHVQVSEQGHALPVQRDHFQQQQQQKQQQQHYIHANPLVQPHPSNPNSLLLPHPSTPIIPIQSYYQMHNPIHPQHQLPQTHPYNSQFPMYLVPVQQNPAYAVPIQQPNLVDGTMVSSSVKPTIPIPSQILPPRSLNTQKPEFTAATTAANVYRSSATTTSVVPQQSSAPQLIQMGDQTRQFITSYNPMQQHPSHSVPPSTYGYEFSNQLHSQPMFYTQATSNPLPSHYQAVSSGAAMFSDAQPQLQQPPDVKQNPAAS